MWNAMKTKSLAAALLITTGVHGSLLWKMNEVATEAASATVAPNPTRTAAGSTTSSPAIRYVTLAPVLIVGRHAPLLADQMAPQATMASSVTEGQCMNNSVQRVTRNEHKDGTSGLC